jgi:hypothetical protein
MAKPQKFPKTIYVKREQDQNSSYFLADESPDSVEHGERVGIYELQEVKTKRVDHSLE